MEAPNVNLHPVDHINDLSSQPSIFLPTNKLDASILKSTNYGTWAEAGNDERDPIKKIQYYSASITNKEKDF